MSKHTKGPWVVNGFGEGFEVLARTRSGVAISSLSPLGGDIEDARLISAAPELLGALRMVDQVFGRMQNSDEHMDSGLMGDDEHEAWRLTKAAIAKAEGRS